MDRYVFFDFDGTLTRRDSFFGFLRYLHGNFGMMKLLLAETCAIIKGLVSGDEGKAKERVLMRALRGLNCDEYRNACDDFALVIRNNENSHVVEALENAVKAGSHVAIVSASIGDWIRPWAALHGVEDVFATECHADNKENLGKFRTANCKGPEKMNRLIEKWPDLAKRRKECHVTAYGNSGGDREMLAFADMAIKV